MRLELISFLHTRGPCCRLGLTKTDKIGCLDDLSVCTIYPCRPGIDVSNVFLHTHSTNHATDIINLLGECSRVGVFAVQIFTTNTNGNDPILTISLDGTLECVFLCLEVGSILGPDTNEQLGTCREGGRDSKSQCVAITRCVQADRCEVAR